jgi:hypothetical protein
VSKTNILRPAKCDDDNCEDLVDKEEDDDAFDGGLDEFTLDEDDF